jgi:ABC-type branched-subunit amino acid transport system ATPase component
MLPEDRRHDGLLLGQSMRVNALLLPGQPRARSGWINRPAERGAAEEIRARMEVDCTSIEQPVGQLSGGNQQKVVLGRWLAAGCRVLLCDEPTRGVDAAAKGTIHRLLREFVNRGGGVLLASGDLAELRAICDRVLVMAGGSIVAEFPRGWSDEAVTAAAFGSAVTMAPGRDPTAVEKAGHSS